MIGLRSDDEIDDRRSADDFFALGLRHAAGDADDHLASGSLPAIAQPAQAAQFGIDLLGRLFADMARVEQHHIRIVGRCRLDIAFRTQRIGHALAVVDVHLAAIGLDENLSHIAGRLRFGLFDFR
jgi:hypothetical protein